MISTFDHRSRVIFSKIEQVFHDVYRAICLRAEHVYGKIKTLASTSGLQGQQQSCIARDLDCDPGCKMASNEGKKMNFYIFRKIHFFPV